MMGGRFSSLPTRTHESVFSRYNFSKFLKYSVYNEETKMYHNNDGSFGYVLLCQPRIRMGSSTAAAIDEIMQKMVEGMYLQVTLIGSKNINLVLEKWDKMHCVREGTEEDDEVRELIKAFREGTVEFIKQKTKEAPSQEMTAKFKDLHLYISVHSDKKDDIQNFRTTLKNILSSNHFQPIVATPYFLKPILYEIFNGNHDFSDIPPYSDHKYINQQIISPSTAIRVQDTQVQSDGRSWISLSPVALPKYAHISDFGEKIGDYLTKALNTNQFRDSFIISNTVWRSPPSKTKKVSMSHSTILNQKWPEKIFRKYAAVKEESSEILDRIDNKKEKLFEMNLTVMVAGDNFEEADANAQNIISYWKKGGEARSLSLDRSWGIHMLNLIASLPMGITDEYINDTVGSSRGMFADQVTQFMPLEGDYKGITPNILLSSRRSQLASIDLFDSNSNYNAYLVATSGAGKSVLLNNLAFNSYSRGDRIFVLDYDNSFLDLCKQLGGQYISLDPATPISFNPFSEIKDTEQLMEDLSFLSDFIYLLGSSKSKRRAEEDEKLIKTKTQDFIRILYNDMGQKLEITHIRDMFAKEIDVRFTDFAAQLGSFCRGGIYSPFLEGPNEFNISKEFITVEFKGVENHPEIRDPLIMLLVYHIGQLMYMNNDRTSKIQIILDEAHRFLGKNPKMDDFIDQAYRRGRKYDASIILATQGFSDIYNPATGGLSQAGSTIINNSAWKFFMKQTETSVNMLINSDVFSFNELEKDMLNNISTLDGQYSEIFTITPDEYKLVYRLVMNKTLYFLTSTKPAHKHRKRELKEQGYSTMDAIRLMIKEEEERNSG